MISRFESVLETCAPWTGRSCVVRSSKQTTANNIKARLKQRPEITVKGLSFLVALVSVSFVALSPRDGVVNRPNAGSVGLRK
jgi:hypothetical protein